MPLEQVGFTPRTIQKGIEVVRNLATLKEIALNNADWMSPAEFWKKCDAGKFKQVGGRGCGRSMFNA